MQILPSILASDFMNLEKEIKKINETSCEIIHLDVMDGVFVPNLTFGMDLIKNIKTITSKKLDIHLMVVNPMVYLDDILKIKPEYVSFHYETISNFNYQQFILELQKNKIKVGLVFNPETPVTQCQIELSLVDFVLIMSVSPGFGGQKFISEVIPKIKEVKKINKKLLIEIDGGINDKTISQITNEQIDLVVAGSYIFSGDYEEQIKKLLTYGAK